MQSIVSKSEKKGKRKSERERKKKGEGEKTTDNKRKNIMFSLCRGRKKCTSFIFILFLFSRHLNGVSLCETCKDPHKNSYDMYT